MKTMARTTPFIVLSLLTLLALTGCGSDLKETGFLSDYSKLKAESKHSLVYLDKEALKQYDRFIVDPVELDMSIEAKAKGKLTDEQIKDLTGYMHAKIVEGVENAGKEVAYRSANKVARIRVSITDLDKSDAISMVPQASLLGAGVGGASIEAEFVDSISGKQIAAIVASRQGSKIPLTNLGDWTAAKQAMDQWGKNLKKRLTD